MIQLGLIGYPLGHSMSPSIHSAALAACDLQGAYSLFPVHPQDTQKLSELMAQLRAGALSGLNVTIPHKQNVISLLDELMPVAMAIGAVNTIYFHDGKLIGDNTDAPGFLKDLHRLIADRRLPDQKSALVLGAGGSARAVLYALLQDGWCVKIAARRPLQAREVASHCSSSQVQAIDSASSIPWEDIDLLVNTTPLGMAPKPDQSPLPEDARLAPHTIVYDLIYNPRQTMLVRHACARGMLATTGLGMLVEQAALAFEKWTGCLPPHQLLLKSVDLPPENTQTGAASN